MSGARPPMDEPLAYFLTWTTYGTWLPGDERGWVGREHRMPGAPFGAPDQRLRRAARARMSEPEVTLDTNCRTLVEKTIRSVSEFNQWHTWAVNCRTNHVHVVVSAGRKPPEEVMTSFKSWSTRRLNEFLRSAGKAPRGKWWTRHGSTRYLNDEQAVLDAVVYVTECQ